MYLEECALLDCLEKSTNPKKKRANQPRKAQRIFDNQLKEAQFAREPQKKEQQKFVREFLGQQAETSESKLLAEARKELQDCIADMKRER